MSFTAAHESKRTRHACQSCRDRKARFSYRGSVRADRDHTLCFECYRRERERQRARHLADVSTRPPFRTPLPASAGAASPTDQQVAHRRAMLAHLEQIAVAEVGRRDGACQLPRASTARTL